MKNSIKCQKTLDKLKTLIELDREITVNFYMNNSIVKQKLRKPFIQNKNPIKILKDLNAIKHDIGAKSFFI